MPKLYDTALDRDGNKVIYMGDGEWVLVSELEEAFNSEVEGRKWMDAQDVMAERAATMGEEL